MSLLVLLSLALAAPEAAPEPTISGDRPGFSYTAAVVPPGLWQTELGVRGVLADDRALQLPILSARLGLTEGVELQLGLPSYTVAEGDADGLGSLAFGVKFGDAPRDWLAYSLVLFAVAPTGDRAVADLRWQGVASLNVELYFAENGWLSLNTQLDTFTDGGGDRALAVTPSAAFGWTIADAFNPFVQVYLRSADGERSPFFGGGVAWLATRRIQLDLSADYDVDGEAVVLDGGISVLW